MNRNRLMHELNELRTDPPRVSAGPVDGDLFHWQAMLLGPEDTPYSGGVFMLNIRFGNDYPFRPPTVQFETRIFHCNVNTSGTICISILKDEWSPALTISKVLLSISSLLAKPNPDDPLEARVAVMMREDMDKFEKTAREWTAKYAL
ncbi:hypothetical protein PCE1_001453 [Barthelona sp. PCE]